MGIEKLRKKIDSIDKKLVELLDERAELALEIGGEKRKSGKKVLELSREAQVVRNAANNSEMLNEKQVMKIYSQILGVSREMQKQVKVSFLGPLGTFSHIAAEELLGSAELVPCESIEDAVVSAEKGESDLAIVPIENSTEGTVVKSLDMLMKTPLKIVGEKKQKVVHNLIAKRGVKLKDIKKIYAHPQAFSQCRKLLSGMDAELQEVSSTAKACRMLDRESAAIASSLAAEIYNLNILKSNVQDSVGNTTRFLVLGREEGKRTGKDKTSIMVGLQDRPGSLYGMLGVFSKKKINLTKIESRPTRQKQWEYVFYIDLLGHKEDAKVNKALKELEKKARFVKVLGSYPRE